MAEEEHRENRYHRLSDLTSQYHQSITTSPRELLTDSGERRADVALPDRDEIPSVGTKFQLFESVSSNVVLEFGEPIISVLLRHRWVAVRTPMPEAAVDEYRDLFSRIADIWLTDHSSSLVSDFPV